MIINIINILLEENNENYLDYLFIKTNFFQRICELNEKGFFFEQPFKLNPNKKIFKPCFVHILKIINEITILFEKNPLHSLKKLMENSSFYPSSNNLEKNNSILIEFFSYNEKNFKPHLDKMNCPLGNYKVNNSKENFSKIFYFI